MLTSSASAGSSGGRMPGRHAASSDLPAPGGPIISRLCAARRGDLERALGGFLALHLLEVRAVVRRLDLARQRLGQQAALPLRWLSRLTRSGAAITGDRRSPSAPRGLARPGRSSPCLASLAWSAASSTPGRRRRSARRAPVRRRRQSPVSCSASVTPIAAEQRQRDRQVVMRCLPWASRRATG